MRINKTKHFKPVDGEWNPSEFDIKVLDFFLSMGRAWIAAFFCVSIGVTILLLVQYPDIIIQRNYLILTWLVLEVFALLYSLPIIFATIKNLILYLIHKSSWDNAVVLGAAFFGWDRFDAKSGKKEIKISMPSGYLKDDTVKSKEVIVAKIKEKLDFANKHVKLDSKITFYRCLLSACDSVGLVTEECKNSPRQRSMFLRSLGEQYQYSERSLKKPDREKIYYKNDEEISYKDLYDSFQEEFRKLLNIN